MLYRPGIYTKNGSAFLTLALLTILLSPTDALAVKDERLERMPEKYQNWLEKEVVYIISGREKEAFLNLQSTEEREAFIEAFWRRRDPDLLTPVNEFKEEHYLRLEQAEHEFGRESAVPGWMTDRGKIYIILGKPDDRTVFPADPGLCPMDVWFYQARKDKSLPPLYLLFFQEGAAGPYRLFNHLLDRPEDLMPAAAASLDPASSRADAYDLLQNASPELAHAAMTMRADESPFANMQNPERAGLDFQVIWTNIEQSPFRRVDTSYVDAAEGARGIVESEYLFNYVPNVAVANVLPGPEGIHFVHYSLEIEPQHMTLAKDEDKGVYYTRFDLRGEVTTLDGEKPILQFVKEPYMTLTEPQFQDIRSRAFSYRDMFPIAGGDFSFRVVLKNQARSEYTIFETELHVPASNNTPNVGPPVLLYDTVELADPETGKLYRTYQLGSLRLNPNAKKVFAIGETLRAYIPIDHRGDELQLVLRIVNREETSQQVTAKTTPLAHYGGEPIVESLPLTGMPGGRYALVAELVGPTGEVVGTATADFDVTPRTSIQRPWVLRETINGEDTSLNSSAVAEQYLKLDDTVRARQLYQKALRDNPNLIPPRIVLAHFQLDEKNPVEAIKLLEPAYAQNKENVDVLLSLGQAHFEVKNYQRAAELYEATITLRAPDPPLFNALGLSHAQLGNTEKAIHYLERSLELEPDQDSVKSLVEKLKNPTPSVPNEK